MHVALDDGDGGSRFRLQHVQLVDLLVVVDGNHIPFGQARKMPDMKIKSMKCRRR